MAESVSGRSFHQDPLGFLDESSEAQPDAFWIPGRQLLLAEPDAAKRVLRNAEGLYQERADFFRLRSGETFGTRATQVRIGRAARDLLRSHLASRPDERDGLIRDQLLPSSAWPDAGNWLIFRHLRPALLAPHRPHELHGLLTEIVERAVLAGARARSSAFRRALFRRRALGALERALGEARAAGSSRKAGEDSARHPSDLLDVVAFEAGPKASLSELAEVFVSFVFAVVGSIGFTLGWSIYFAGTQSAREVPAAWRVREALRLGPVAWMLGSRPAREHEVAGIAVTPRDEVVACPYLAHRHPAHWDDPETYRPERWADRRRPFGFLPFGWGPHKCPAATLSTDLVAGLLDRLLSGYHLRVVASDSRPHVGAALAPPRFVLHLEPRAPQNPTKGGD